MQQELRLATFNVCNLALPGMKYYDDQEPYTLAEYEAKTGWIARQLDLLDADVIAFQEIFSQAALKHALAKTEKYQDAHHFGFDADPLAAPKPGLALVSRLQPVGGACSHTVLPRGLSIALPGVEQALTAFTRPVLQVSLALSRQRMLHVYVCHLKSKRPDYRNESNDGDPYQHGIANLRSLVRRGADALGLRYLVSDQMRDSETPVVVMGDFNDIVGAVTTQLVMGCGLDLGGGLRERLFDSYRIQSRRDPLRDVGYTHVHDACHETVDHILVSEQFNPASASAIGEVLELSYLNDHLALQAPEASDHGLVLARIRLFEEQTVAASFELPPAI